jgi:hypothetical protein
VIDFRQKFFLLLNTLKDGGENEIKKPLFRRRQPAMKKDLQLNNIITNTS